MQYRHQNAAVRFAFTAFGVVMALFLVVPLLAVVPLSFSASSFLSYPIPSFSVRWYETVFQDGPWMASLKNSLVIGVVSTIAAVILGTLAAYALARSTRLCASICNTRSNRSTAISA